MIFPMLPIFGISDVFEIGKFVEFYSQFYHVNK